jgi:hypothetical protein
LKTETSTDGVSTIKCCCCSDNGSRPRFFYVDGVGQVDLRLHGMNNIMSMFYCPQCRDVKLPSNAQLASLIGAYLRSYAELEELKHSSCHCSNYVNVWIRNFFSNTVASRSRKFHRLSLCALYPCQRVEQRVHRAAKAIARVL